MGFTHSLRVSLILVQLFECNQNSNVYSLQGDFTSIELRDGHVVFKFGFRDEPHAIMITEHTYNTNNWTGVQAKRRGRGGCCVLEADICIHFSV